MTDIQKLETRNSKPETHSRRLTMQKVDILAALKPVDGLKVKTAEPLARYTTMKIGGPADYFLDVDSGAALVAALRLLSAHRIPFCLLGKGNNVLVSDRGVRGAVLRLGGEFTPIPSPGSCARRRAAATPAWSSPKAYRAASAARCS